MPSGDILAAQAMTSTPAASASIMAWRYFGSISLAVHTRSTFTTFALAIGLALYYLLVEM